MKITEPLIELLAITLHHEACVGDNIKPGSWFKMIEEDREIFRDMARGLHDLDSSEGADEPQQ